MTEQLTREQVMAMEPGLELDALVEHEVIGTRRPAKGWSINPRHYSTDISAAWEVVEKVRSNHVYELADFGRNTHKDKQHFAAFHPIDKPRNYERQVRAKALPEAICKAALLAVMGL